MYLILFEILTTLFCFQFQHLFWFIISYDHTYFIFNICQIFNGFIKTKLTLKHINIFFLLNIYWHYFSSYFDYQNVWYSTLCFNSCVKILLIKSLYLSSIYLWCTLSIISSSPVLKPLPLMFLLYFKPSFY